MEALPEQHDQPGNDGIFEDQAQRDEQCPIANAGQHSYTHIRDSLPQSRAREHIGLSCRTEVAIHQGKREQNGAAKYERRSNQSSSKLCHYQEFATQRRQKIIMQALLNNLAFEEPGEESHASEEGAQSQI